MVKNDSASCIKDLSTFTCVHWAYRPVLVHVCMCIRTCVYTHPTHTQTHFLQTPLSLRNYLLQLYPLVGIPTKGSARLPCSDGSLREKGSHVTHPSPPPGIWATAAFQEALWAPAEHGGKALPPAATSGWHPRSSAGGPGRSGRRQTPAGAEPG